MGGKIDHDLILETDAVHQIETDLYLRNETDLAEAAAQVHLRHVRLASKLDLKSLHCL